MGSGTCSNPVAENTGESTKRRQGDYNPDSVKQLGADIFIEKPFSSIQDIVDQLEKVWSVKNK